jgi:outer membrane immunogenic protein
MTKLTIAAGVALALTAGSAFAADLPSHKAPPPYIPPPPVFCWSGIYGGVNIGYGFGSGDQQWGVERNWGIIDGGFWTGFPGTQLTLAGPGWTQPTNLNGVVGGGQLGFNYQFNPWLVLGVETDIQASGLASNSTGLAVVPATFLSFAGANLASNTTNSYVDWYGSLRFRAGLTLPSMPNLLIYGTGGLAYGGVNTVSSHTNFFAGVSPAFGAGSLVANGNGAYDSVKFGWTAGGGLEYAPMSFPNWSVRVEYLYTDLGNATINTVGFGAPGGFFALAPVDFPINYSATTVRTSWHTVRVGLNYRVNMCVTCGGVVAKY